MNELKSHKKSDKIKWIITGILFVLLFVFLAGLCMQLFAKDDKYKPSEWVKKPDTKQTIPENDNPETAAMSYIAPRSLARATALSETVAYSNETYSSLGVSLTDSEISNLATIFGSLSIVSNSFIVRNNIDSSTMSGALLLQGSVPNMLSSVFMLLLLPKVNVFTGLSSCVFESCVVQNESNGNVINPNTSYLQYFPEDFYVYSWVKGPSIPSYSITYNLLEVKKPVPLPPDPVKEGYTFVGWYFDSNFTEQYDGRPIFEDTALYAKFEINKFIVTFDSNGGAPVLAVTVNWNTAITFLHTPLRPKYAFKGWYLPNGTQYTNQPIKENTTLTARWERSVFNVTFVVDGGSSVDNTEVNLNSSINLPDTTRTGYTFKGWFMADGTEYTNQPVTTDITLTAHWEINHYTVTFYVDGEVYSTKTVEHGSQLLKVASEQNLVVMSVYSDSPDFAVETLTAKGVTTDLSVIATEMDGTDKVINTVKNNKWAIIGGVAGGIALIAVIAAIVGGTKRRKR